MISGYSTVILSTLRQIGLGDDEIRRATQLSKASLKAVAVGEREFEDSELSRIEDATGKTIGQLAAMALEPAGGKFSELMDLWAEFSHAIRRAETNSSKAPKTKTRRTSKNARSRTSKLKVTQPAS